MYLSYKVKITRDLSEPKSQHTMKLADSRTPLNVPYIFSNVVWHLFPQLRKMYGLMPYLLGNTKTTPLKKPKQTNKKQTKQTKLIIQYNPMLF